LMATLPRKVISQLSKKEIEIGIRMR
jgi:hypothetical protein